MSGFWDDLFDLDGDGKTDVFEEYAAYLLFEEMTKEDDEDVEETDGFFNWDD